jgi:hypothetical protein
MTSAPLRLTALEPHFASRARLICQHADLFAAKS